MYNTKCPYCGELYSESVYPIHLAWCKKQYEKDSIDEDDIDEIQEFLEEENQEISPIYTVEQLNSLKATELYKICMKLGVKVAKKQNPDFYVEKIMEKQNS